MLPTVSWFTPRNPAHALAGRSLEGPAAPWIWPSPVQAAPRAQQSLTLVVVSTCHIVSQLILQVFADLEHHQGGLGLLAIQCVFHVLSGARISKAPWWVQNRALNIV